MMTLLIRRPLKGNQQRRVHSNRPPNRTVQTKLIHMAWPARLHSQPFKNKLRRLMVPMPSHQFLTRPSACHANGLQQLDPESGVSGTTRPSYNSGHLNTLTYLPGSVLDRQFVMAQFLLQGPAQRSGSHPGSHIWAFLAQGPQSPQPTKLPEGNIRLLGWVKQQQVNNGPKQPYMEGTPCAQEWWASR